MINFDLIEVQKKIGYTFASWELLYTAFTHSSYANERGVESYERLEFLGDSILGFVIAQYLYEEYSKENEGFLTKTRANLVSARTLAAAIDKLGLIDSLMTSGGAAQKEVLNSMAVKSDLFEAIVAAIMLDSGSIEACKKFVLRSLKQFINEDYFVENTDYKTTLNEYCHKVDKKLTFNTVEAENNMFAAEVSIDGVVVAKGEGTSKKKAEQHAASIYLGKISL